MINTFGNAHCLHVSRGKRELLQLSLKDGADKIKNGDTLGLALDLDAGTLLISVNGGEWAVVFNDSCTPSAVAGAALFPAMRGSVDYDDATNEVYFPVVRCNWGTDKGRPMRHNPPSEGYRPVGVGLVQQVRFFTFDHQRRQALTGPRSRSRARRVRGSRSSLPSLMLCG
jgi:hypothetical protein